MFTGISLYIVDVIKLSRTFLVKNLIVVSFRSWNVQDDFDEGSFAFMMVLEWFN